jgi:hypothetical protein
MSDPVADFELDRVRRSHPAWRICRKGSRFVASDGGHREVIGRSARELGVLLDGEAWKPLTARNPSLPPCVP